MKNFSVNLLKVGLLLILGLCVFSVGNEVEAVYGYSDTPLFLDVNQKHTFDFSNKMYNIGGGRAAIVKVQIWTSENGEERNSSDIHTTGANPPNVLVADRNTGSSHNNKRKCN